MSTNEGRPRFAGKVAVVTGASSGIGRAVAARLAAEGATVATVGRSERRLRSAADATEEGAGQLVPFPADVGVAAEVEGLIAAVARRFGGLDLIAHSAGIRGPIGRVTDFDERDWDAVLDTNAKSCFLLARHGIPLIKERGGGSVVNVSSSTAAATGVGGSLYSASKAAMNLFTLAAAIEYAKDGIRFNAVAPGMTRTSMLEEDLRAEGLEIEAVERFAPIGRLIEPGEVASLVLYLLSDEAAALTGGVHPVDGGRVAVLNQGNLD